jgi:hypothetical protein
MRSRSSSIVPLASAASSIGIACVMVAALSIGEAQSATWECPGYPMICQESCRLDDFDTPIYCLNGQCACAPGYDTVSGPDSLSCQPKQPELGSQSHVGGCSLSCTSMPWGSAQGPWKDFDILAVHGTSPGGEAFTPVWGFQANPPCGVHGVPVLPDADGTPIRSWGGVRAGSMLLLQWPPGRKLSSGEL